MNRLSLGEISEKRIHPNPVGFTNSCTQESSIKTTSRKINQALKKYQPIDPLRRMTFFKIFFLESGCNMPPHPRRLMLQHCEIFLSFHGGQSRRSGNYRISLEKVLRRTRLGETDIFLQSNYTLTLLNYILEL